MLLCRDEVRVSDKLVCPICLSGYIATDSKYELLEKENAELKRKNEHLILWRNDIVKKWLSAERFEERIKELDAELEGL